MLAESGIVVLFVAFLASVLGVLCALIGLSTGKAHFYLMARNALILTLPAITIVGALLIVAQVSGHYEIAYASQVSKDAQPLSLKITGLWGGQPGSLILWAWMLSLFMVASLWLNWKQENHLMPWVMVVTGGTLAFFLLLSQFYENPFQRTWALPNGDVVTQLLAPEDAVLAYPYQSDTQGQFYHTETDAFIPSIPDARYDGHGLNPLLRHPGMIIHPPMLYLGFTGFIIPFAFAIAALMVRDMSLGWIRATRRWSLIAWMFLSIGLILGGRWAYDVLGWGGYWGWDPVENSSFLPWLTGTAFLHSVMIQERRGMLKGWNMVMIMLTYLLVLFGTVATRTGLLSSVHTFAQSPLAIPMGLFLALTIVLCIGLFLKRGSEGLFENDHQLEGLVSRESLFLFNNWVFLAITVVVFWGTWSELITGLLRDVGLMQNVINLGPEYYEMITPWLFLLLFLLMGVAPLAAWRKASASKLGLSLRIPSILSIVTFIALLLTDHEPIVSMGYSVVAFAGYSTLLELYKGSEARHRAHGESWGQAFLNLFSRDRRRYGGYLIHLGVVIMGIGIIASTAFQEVRQQTLTPRQSMSIGDYTVRYDRSFEAEAVDGRGMVIADVTLFKDGQEVNQLRPRRDYFGGSATPMTIAGLHSTLENDVYVLLTFWENDQMTFRVYRNPLVNFIWFGSLMLVIGTFVAAWPEAQKQTRKLVQPVRMQARPAAAGD
jgi:cytochrome c-type biogenesis protein CcmF